MVVAFARASSIKVEIYWHIDIICTILKLERVFSAPLLIAHTPNNLHSITYHENNVQSPIKTYLIIALQFFTCLNCIRAIKFHFAKLDFALTRVISL